MKKILPAVLAALVILIAPMLTCATQNEPDASFTVVPVRGGIFMLQGRGGNIGVSAGPDGLLMIDDSFLPMAKALQEALATLGKGKPRFLLNTHWHGDHTGGNPAFGPESTIISHANVRKRLMGRQEVKLFNSVVEPLPSEGLPVITFDESLSIHFNGEEIRVLHLPHGHTDGDAVIFFAGSNVVHLGDHFFNTMFPFVDLDSGGNVVRLAANVKTILDQVPADVKIIPGHGPLGTRDDLVAFHEMLIDSCAFVREQEEKGMDLAAIQAAGLPERFEPWSHGILTPAQWIGIVHGSLGSCGKLAPQ